jgi:hypothetical protein
VNELTYILANNVALSALAAWLLTEKVLQVRARRKEHAARVKTMAAAQRSADELGRRLAFGSSIGHLMGVPDCNDPNCIIHKKGETR